VAVFSTHFASDKLTYTSNHSFWWQLRNKSVRKPPQQKLMKCHKIVVPPPYKSTKPLSTKT